MKIKNRLLWSVKPKWVMIIVMLASFGIFYNHLYQSSRILTSDTSGIDDHTSPGRVYSVSVDGGISKGKSDSPVSVIEFGDFQCPFCRRFEIDTEPQLQRTYIDTGKIKFVFIEYPMQDIHPNAMSASLAAECANEQGRFWVYHDMLYSQQSRWENLDANKVVKTLTALAADVDLNVKTFNLCINSMKYQMKINKQIEEGKRNLIDATPTFYIGNDNVGYTQLSGTQPFVVIQQIIDQYVS